MSGMATLPKPMSCCLRWFWGGLCWSQQPCLARFLPKLFRSLRWPNSNARVRHGVSICGVVCGCCSFPACSPGENWHLRLTRELQRCENPRAERRCLWEGKPVLILILETQDLPCCKKSRYYNHHYVVQEKPFCSSSTQLGTVIGTPIEPNCAVRMESDRVCVCLNIFFSSHSIFF